MHNTQTPSGSGLPPLPETFPELPDPAVGADGSDDAGDGLSPVPRLPLDPIRRFRAVRAGCWLLNYTPSASTLVSYDGTMRVEASGIARTASGDLYQRPLFVISRFPLRTLLGAPPSPTAGIPILARSRYRYYVRVTNILEHLTSGNSFDLGFELHRFTAATGAWALEGAFTARMTWIGAPTGYPSASDYLEGDVRNAAGAIVGRLKMGWVSPRLRKVKVEIDNVSGCEQPLDSGTGIGWSQVFDALNWEASVSVSDSNVAEPSGAGWSDGEMHAAMLARRDAVNLDSAWHYHILAVKAIDSTPRGIMYDNGGTDSNKVPREGVGIATSWVIPNTPEWGQVRGQRFGAAKAPYFRTAVHELGHAFGLFHNTINNGFMNTTDVIAGSATPAQPFPTNIVWAFAANDLKKLRHYPDIFVRPGGTAFGTASGTAPPITPDDEAVELDSLRLVVTPLMGELPIGAPARIKLELVNDGDETMIAPATLSLKSEFVRGWVTDPSGLTRSFSTMVRCIEEQPMRELKPKESVAHDLTLMRGAEGALFPAPGLYTIGAEVRWDAGGAEAVVRGESSILVTGALTAGHAAAAHEVLATPDAHVVLVVGGDHLEEGMAAIHAALDDQVLAPHYQAIEAKRIAGLKRRAKVKGKSVEASVDQLIDENSVMSASEVAKLAKLVRGRAQGATRDAARDTLRNYVAKRHMDGDATAAVAAI